MPSISANSAQLISVIMPAFNARHWIAQAIESIQAQTWANWELIVMDDGSIDNTATLVQAMAAIDKRINYYFQTNQGQGMARAAAIKNSKGQWLALLDADDYWLPDRLTVGMKHLSDTGADLFYSSSHVLYNDSSKPMGLFPAEDGTMSGMNGLSWLLNQNNIPALTTLFRRDAYDRAGGFGSYAGIEDYALWLSMLATGSRFVAVSQALTVYRWHEKSHTSADRLMADDCLQMFRQQAVIYPLYNKLIKTYMVKWIEERVCRGCTAQTKLGAYMRYHLMGKKAMLLFNASVLLPGRWRAKLLPKLAML